MGRAWRSTETVDSQVRSKTSFSSQWPGILARRLPDKVSPCTLWRWSAKGFCIRAVDRIIRLRYVHIGRRLGGVSCAAWWILHLYDWLIQGKPIRRSAVPGMLKNVYKARFKWKVLDYLTPSRLPARTRACVRALVGLLDVLEARPWDDGYCRAQVLVAMCQISRRDGWKYFRSHKSCQEQTPVWAEGCRVFLPASRKWLAKWRQHKDVEMYAVANYTIAIRGGVGLNKRLGGHDLHEMADSARDALKTLVYDSTPRYLACTLCEAELRLGQNDAFLASMKQHQSLIRSQDQRFWMEGYKALPKILGHFEQLLQSGNEVQYRVATKNFLNNSRSHPRWAKRLWGRLLRDRVSFWKWLGYAIRLR